jgi:hypothetical protein
MELLPPNHRGASIMDNELKALIEKARETKVSDAEKQVQQISFAFGNLNAFKDTISRDTVRQASEAMAADKCTKKGE